MGFKREPETERIVTTLGQTVTSLGLSLVNEKTTTSSLTRKVTTNYLVVGKIATCLVADRDRDLLN